MKNIRRFALGIFFLILSLIYFYLGRGYPVRTLIFPNFLNISLFILSIIMIIQGIGIVGFVEGKTKKLKKNEIIIILIVTITIIAYIKLMEMIGFLYITPLFLIVGLRAIGYKNWFINLIFSISIVLIINYLFTNIMYVPLP